MRSLNRNKRSIYYALYTGESRNLDEYGNEKIVPMLYAIPFGKKANDRGSVRRDGDRVRDYGYWFKTFGVEENK